MELFSFIFVMSSAFVLAGIGFFYTTRTHKKDVQKRNLRRYLAEKMAGTRLPKMLQALGVGNTEFIYKTPIDTLSETLKNCEVCTSTEECTEKLKIPELNPEDVDFCLNKKYLSRSSRSQRVKG